MHVVNGHDETLTVKLDDGKVYRITMIDGSAHVPDHVGRYLIDRGYATLGPDANPKPEWKRAGDGWGDLIPMFSKWCTEIK